jgi:phosphoribosylanthranilate isomerase
MRRTRVKICGITRPKDAAAAAEAGADSIGMVLHAPSKRLIGLEQAGQIMAALGPFVSAVGLFVDAPADVIHTAAADLGLSAVQLHGHESLEFVETLHPLPVIKVIHVEAATLAGELRQWTAGRPQNLIGLLLDTAAAGGSGVANDWDAISKQRLDFPWIAAGGLTPSTVGDIVRRLRPWAVDVSTGVEDPGAPGEKSPELIRKFIAAVRDADIS